MSVPMSERCVANAIRACIVAVFAVSAPASAQSTHDMEAVVDAFTRQGHRIETQVNDHANKLCRIIFSEKYRGSHVTKWRIIREEKGTATIRMRYRCK